MRIPELDLNLLLLATKYPAESIIALRLFDVRLLKKVGKTPRYRMAPPIPAMLLRNEVVITLMSHESNSNEPPELRIVDKQ